MGICLNMIVRNEEKNLPRLFATLRGVADYYVISDTGSTDNTIVTIESLGRQYGIPGEVHEDPWVDFSHNRNRVLEEALESRRAGRHRCHWIMIIDADEELVELQQGWKERLSRNTSYNIYTKTESFSYARLFLAWLDGQAWAWKGRVHNNLVNAVKGHHKGFLFDAYIVYHDFQGAKSHAFKDRQEKARTDIIHLTKELGEAKITAANMSRFYQLAFCYLNAEEFQKAFETMDMVRSSGYASEMRRYSVLLFLANCLVRERRDLSQALAFFDEAISLDPQRKEAYFYKASLMRKQGKAMEAMTLLEQADAMPFEDRGYLMKEDAIYNWRILYELAFLYFTERRLDKASQVIEKLMKENRVPPTEKSFLESLKNRLPEGRLGQ